MYNKDHLFYLASPYSHPNPMVRSLRYEEILYIASELINEGYHLIEPIAMSHHKSLKYELPGDYAFWQSRDRKLLSKCDGIIVVTMKGWGNSKGVRDEIAYARELGIPVYYIHPEKYLRVVRSELL